MVPLSEKFEDGSIRYIKYIKFGKSKERVVSSHWAPRELYPIKTQQVQSKIRFPGLMDSFGSTCLEPLSFGQRAQSRRRSGL